MSEANGPLLRLSRLNVAFGKRAILHDVALSVRAGRIRCHRRAERRRQDDAAPRRGRAGAGAGDLIVGGDDVRHMALAERARRIAYLPQGQVFHWPLAVSDVVGLGRLPRGRGASLSAADREAVAAAMAATGVTDYAERPSPRFPAASGRGSRSPGCWRPRRR